MEELLLSSYSRGIRKSTYWVTKGGPLSFSCNVLSLAFKYGNRCFTEYPAEMLDFFEQAFPAGMSYERTYNMKYENFHRFFMRFFRAFLWHWVLGQNWEEIFEFQCAESTKTNSKTWKYCLTVYISMFTHESFIQRSCNHMKSSQSLTLGEKWLNAICVIIQN